MTIDVDNSTLGPVAECTTHTALKALGYKGYEQSEAIDVGSVFHAGLEGYFRGEDPFFWFDREWNNLFPEERVIDKEMYYYTNVRDIFQKYIDDHPLPMSQFEVIDTEQTVGMPLNESGRVWFWMKRDLKVIENQTGNIVPLDHKTTGQALGEWWQKKWRMGSQLTGYIWATQMETGRPSPFAYVNAIQILKLPNSSRKCYTHQMKYSECRLEHTNFQLLTFGREQHQIDQWRRDALMLAFRYDEIKKMYPDLDSIQFAPNEGAFLGMGGCSGCEFSKYCRMGKRPQFAEGLLVYSPWRPWEEDNVVRIDWRK